MRGGQQCRLSVRSCVTESDVTRALRSESSIALSTCSAHAHYIGHSIRNAYLVHLTALALSCDLLHCAQSPSLRFACSRAQSQCIAVMA
eukprot:6277-Heterococcus_DN1.PRE.2